MKKHKIHLAIDKPNSIKTQCGKDGISTWLLTTTVIEEVTCLKCQQGYQLSQPTIHYLKQSRDAQSKPKSACGKSRSNLTTKISIVNCRGCKRSNSYHIASVTKRLYRIRESRLIPVRKLPITTNKKR